MEESDVILPHPKSLNSNDVKKRRKRRLLKHKKPKITLRVSASQQSRLNDIQGQVRHKPNVHVIQKTNIK